MTTQEIPSFTDPETIYSLTINQEGYAIDCNCPSHYYAKRRNPDKRHFCKHIAFYNQQKGLADAAELEARRHAPLNSNRGFSLL